MDGEFAGGAPPVEDFTKMSVEDRLASKAWKARVSAYEELVKSFARTSSDADPIFRTYARNPELIRAMVVDSNAVAQEKGVDAARAFVEFGGNAAGRTREVVVPSLVEKCLGSTRAGTKKNALELVMLYAENEDVMGCEGLTSDLLAGLKAKQPKVVAGCVAALKDLTRDFGHKQVKPNQILKKLPDIFAHSDKTVRAEGALLAQELYRCIGAAIEPTISALKEIQAKELRQQFEAIEGKSTPTRFLISQRAVVEAAAAAAPAAEADAGGDAADDGAGGQDDEDDIDPYDLADPVDVFGSRDFPDNLDEMLASKKWQERKEALEAVLKVMNSSLKMKPDSRFDGLADSLAHKITKDANINVVLVSCQCLEAMAKGLREGFARYKEKVVPPIIEKLKEKKASTVEVLAKTLDAIFQTVSFSDILENVLNGLKHKNPSVKTESIRFLVRCLRTTRTPPAKGDIKPIGDALVAAMGDGSPDVRDAGAAGLGTLMKLIGERPMNAFLEPLDDIKKGKPASATEPVKYRFNSEDAEARAADLIPEGIAAQLASGVWKDRLAGMTDFNAWLEREVDEVEAEIIVRALGKKPGWKESNFQVLAEVYKALRKLAEASPTFGRPSVALSVQPLCDKLGDIKLKGPAAETLGLYAEKTSYGFLLNQALGPLAGLKAPKAIADSILWVDQSLLEFGTAGVDVRGLIGYLVTCLKSANAGVRTNATKAIGTLARFLGTTLNSFLGDLNPQLKTTIEAEIEQAASNPPPAPTRFSDENRLPEAAAGGGGGGRGGDDGAAGGAGGGIDEDLLDELVPRVDIDKLVHGSTVARMSDANWKERKEALEEIQGIVTANTRLKGNMTELAAALKLRYSDSNIMCKTLALDVAAKIATGMNKNFEPHARILVGPITQVLSDAKAPVRASAVATLTAIAEQIGVGPMVPGFCSVLESSKIANPMLRQELFAWLGAWFEGHMPEKGMDLAGLALPAVQSLDDKLAAVRKAAQSALPYIVLRAGYKFVLEQANQLKAASRNTVVPLIDAAKSQAAALQPAAAARAAPAPAAAPAAARPGLARPGAARPAAAPAASAGPSSSGSSPVSAVRASSASRIPSSEEPDIGVPQSRLGMTKRAPAAASSSSSAPSSSSVPDQGPPFLSADLRPKALREKREGRGQNWIGAEGAPRPELVDVLRSQCEGSLSRGLIDSLFSKGNSAEKEYMSALTLIANFVSSPSFAEEEYGLSPDDTNGRIVANSDLVFKYVAIRLTDNNTTMSLKCLDILEQLVDLLSGQQFHMSDYEANSLLPCLLAKFGDPKVTFRDRIREIFRKLTFIFPPSKLFTHYMENGLPSKNARVRTECLGELGHLIAKNGLQVCSPAKTFPVIAKQISDRDANVRTAALMALGEAYKLVGDDVWKMIGSLPGKEMSLLEERLKRTAAPAAKPSAIARAPASKMGRATPGCRRGRALDLVASARLEMGSSRSRSSSQSQPSQYAYVRNSGSRLANSVTDADVGYDDDEADARQDGFGDADRDDDDDGDDGPYGGTGSLRVEQTINEILSSDAERSVAALKDVHQFLEQGEPSMVSHADQLGNVLAKQAHRAFSMADSDAGNERLIKHILFDLLSMFDKELVWDEGRPLGSYLGKQTLVPLLTELLQQLIEESAKPPGDERAQTLAKYLNNVVLKCFSACDLNALYGACLSMLTEATEDMRELSGAVLDTRVKFAELTMKCLWKIAKRLPSCLAEQQIDPAQLIADIEEFMKVITPNEWKRRAADGVPMGDMPLKTMKVILTHITSTFGEESLSMLELLESPESSHVYSYLMRLLNQHGAGPADRGAAQPSPEAGESERAAARPARSRASVDGNGNGNGNGASYAAPSANSAPGSPRASANGDGGVGHGNGQGNGAPRVVSTDVEDPATAELRAIFERISHKEQSRIAIRQLYEFQKKYPHKEPSIQRALQNTGPIFQRYVKRALANHAADDLEASSAVASPQLGETERPESGTFTSSARTSLRSSLNMDAGAGAASTAAVTPSLPTSASFARHSPSSSISASTSTTSPKGSSHLRSSTHDDRLAELRAKFAKTSTGSSISSSSSSVSTSRADMTAAGGGGGGGGGGAAEVD
ncbi:uncharacterized protein PFL1_03004 [Pseudozyma flocculosa PF-1]|uniref:TOG domain-containing protein n=1 Tax=Pseudozyma flocculosa PF-1 TaxID=1277687 RepID=A0A061H9W1_9BASI|nr:uncharacterized protein PFL1_03004 [Pseudozyma flocculosa PF-1]EPQ29249.1 hypothetical protein PFL1_03004 [Pseudozyma flocculosa PF-1]